MSRCLRVWNQSALECVSLWLSDYRMNRGDSDSDTTKEELKNRLKKVCTWVFSACVYTHVCQMINESTVHWGCDGQGPGGLPLTVLLPHPPEHSTHQLVTHTHTLTQTLFHHTLGDRWNVKCVKILFGVRFLGCTSLHINHHDGEERRVGGNYTNLPSN